MINQTDPQGSVNFGLSTRLAQAAVALALLGTLVVYVWALILGVQTVREPFAGAFVEPTLVVNSVGDDDWRGRAAGLDLPDHLAAIDGQPLTSPRSLYDRISRRAIGDILTLSVVRPEGGQRVVAVELQAFPPSAAVGYLVFPYGIGLAYLLIGLTVFAARREQPAGRAIPLFCVAFALAAGTLFDLYTTHHLVTPFVIGLALAGGSLTHLALVFPQRSDAVNRWPWLAALAYVPSVAIAGWALSVTADLSRPWDYILAWRSMYLYAALGAVLWVAMLIRRRLRTDSPVVREQTRIILLGVVAGGLPLILWFILAALNLGIDFQPLLLAPLVLLPLSMAYAILRYRLLDVDHLIGRSVSYGAMALLVLGSYLLIVNLLSLLVGSTVQVNNPFLIALLVVGVTLTFNPLRERLNRSIDKLFFRDRIDYRQALETYSHDLGRLLSRNAIFSTLTERIEAAVHPQRLMFFVYDEPSAQFVPFSHQEGPARGVHFAPRGGLARLLVEQQNNLHLMPGQPLPEAFILEADQIEAVGATLYVPLPQQGWMALGEKRSGDPYSSDDLAYLEALGDQTSLALDRIHLISDLERRVTELNALRWISQAVHFTVGLDDLLELIYAQTSRVLNTNNFYIALYDEAKGTLSFAFYVENGERYYPTDEWPLSMGGLQGEIIRQGQPIVTNDYLTECLDRGISPGGKAERAWMGVPLNAGDHVIGVMNVSSSEPGVSYSPDQLSIFSAIADQAAAIIDKARLDAEMEERARQLSVLNEVGSAVNSSLDLPKVLRLITAKAAEILDAEAGSLFLTDYETDELVFEVAVGPSSENLVGMRLAPGTGIVGKTAQAQQPVIVNDTQKAEEWFSGTDESTGFITRAILSVPLVHKGETIGVIQILNKRDGSPFDEQDTQLLLAFASSAAAALENARLFTMTDQQLAARVDELSMFQKIDRALNATLDYEHVIMLTLDWALRITEAQVGAVFTLDEERGGLFTIAARGYPPEFDRYREHPWSVSDGILGRAVRRGDWIRVNDVSQDEDYIATVPETRSKLVIPLRLGEEVIGAISLESPEIRGFSEEDLQFAIRLAERAVVPIENAQLYDQVKRANEAKSQFVSMVAHELKVPMTSIKGYAKLLELGEGPLDDTKRGFIKTINSNVDRMTKTVNDLLDISRIETGRLKLEMEEVSLASVIEETLASLRGAIEAKGLELKLSVPADLPLVWGDRNRLVQVLINLVSNATKYTVKGSIHIKANAVEHPLPDNGRLGHFVACSVIDTGIGISKEDQERLFKSQFVRFENAVEVAPGHGLGLWLVNRLAELQGGEITFESELGKGSVFSCLMPVANDTTKSGKR
jgi:signal transduction histidine kinase